MNGKRFSMHELHTANSVEFKLKDDHGWVAASVSASTYDPRFMPSRKRVEKAFRIIIGGGADLEIAPIEEDLEGRFEKNTLARRDLLASKRRRAGGRP